MQRQALERGIDLYMRVPLRRFGMLDFDKASEIIAAGRELAREKLKEWQAAAPDDLAPAELVAMEAP